MRTLTFSTLYPNSAQPRHGIFNEQRLRHLVATGEVESVVVAPTPWFPYRHSCFGRYATHARVPAMEERHGLRVLHPRFPLIPRVSMSASPLLLAAAARPAVEELRAEGDDVITLPLYRLPRRMILAAVAGAAGVTTVCQALKDTLVALGAAAEAIQVVLMGVDVDLFRPVDREAVRARLGLAGTVLLSVGHLTRRKGHHLAIAALPEIPGATLLIAGDGWYEEGLRALAAAHGVADRVRFLGHVDQEELPDFYGAADALVLASSREGIANVLIESMACGTPVIATAVWGTPEAVNVPAAGVLMRERSAGALAEAARRLFADYPDRAATRRHAESFRWDRLDRAHLAALAAAAVPHRHASC